MINVLVLNNTEDVQGQRIPSALWKKAAEEQGQNLHEKISGYVTAYSSHYETEQI